MLVITALNIVVVIMAYLARFDKHRYLLAWAFLLLALVLGIRYGYGNDFFTYKYMFDHGYPEKGLAENVEPGWFFLNQLFRPFGFSVFVFLLTVVEHLLLYNLIRRYVPPHYYWLAVFIYLFNPSYMLIGLSMMRQFFVQILGFYAMAFAYKRKYIQFAVIILICISIHKVGYLLVPLIMIPWILRFSSSKSLLIFSSVILFGIIYIATNMNVVIDNLVEIFAQSDMKYGNSYLNDTDIGEERRINPKLIIMYALYLLLLARTFKFLPDNNPSKLFAIEVTLGLIFIPFSIISPMAMRTSWVYSIVVIITMPLLIQYEKVPIIKYGTIICFALLLFREYYNHFCSDIYGAYYMNYHTIFSEYAIDNIRMY